MADRAKISHGYPLPISTGGWPAGLRDLGGSYVEPSNTAKAPLYITLGQRWLIRERIRAGII